MKLMHLCVLGLALPLSAEQPDLPLTAEAIMARVAANQDTAEADRSHYVYIQHARVTSHKGNKVMCEETTDSRVTPSAKGSQQQILKLNGRMLLKGNYVTYTEPSKSQHDGISISTGDDDSDRNLVESMRQTLTSDHSKDGIAANLFPLTTKELQDESFKLLGRERMNGREVFHIAFTPKDKSDYGWKGDAFIDAAAFQPVLIHTAMSRKIPFAVRALMGTNVPGLGFSVTYGPQPDGVWFPTSFGTEFKIKLLFFYSRSITLSAENRDFEKTHVTSTIVDEPAQPAQPQ